MENNEALNRRKHTRHDLQSLISVIDRETGQSIGSLANVSLEGLMVVNNVPLGVDCIYQLSLRIDGSLVGGASGQSYDVHVGVDCLWNSPAASTAAAAYWSGCQIIDASDDDFSVIEQLVDALAAH